MIVRTISNPIEVQVVNKDDLIESIRNLKHAASYLPGGTMFQFSWDGHRVRVDSGSDEHKLVRQISGGGYLPCLFGP